MADPAYNPWAAPIFPQEASFGTGSPSESAGAYPNPLAGGVSSAIGKLLGLFGPGYSFSPSMQRPDTSQEQIRFTTASPYVNITNEDINRGLSIAQGVGPLSIRSLPSSSSLATPPAPTAADVARSRIENVPLSQARGTQSRMDWQKFNAGDHPPPLIEGYSDLPLAVRKENGEYLIFDGHHRAVNAINGGAEQMPMRVIDAKDYAPEFAGRKPQPSNISDDELLKMLFEGEKK